MNGNGLRTFFAGGSFSATTAIAAILTYLLGAYALVGDVRIAAGAAAAATAILAVREEPHGWVAKIMWIARLTPVP